MFRISRWATLTGLAGLAVVALTGCGADRAVAPPPVEDAGVQRTAPPEDEGFGKFVVANRGAGTISVLAAADGTSLGTFPLPAGPGAPEPMYAVYVERTGSVVVGDRANSRVVEFDAESFAVLRTAPAGAGVFHMWVDPVRNRQLWVNNDIDNTATVIDPVTFDVLATVPMPADLVALGAKPHDVVLDPLGRYAYVTLLGGGADDHVVQFDTATFAEKARAAVGQDPHVSLTRRNGLLYVACQNSSVVQVLDRGTLEHVTAVAVPGAHGAGMTQSGRYFYTTNLSGGGTEGLWALDTTTSDVVGAGVDTPYPVPHNVALTRNGQRLFLTHSGAMSDKVTFWAVSAAAPLPVLLGEVTVGLNPFGITWAP